MASEVYKVLQHDSTAHVVTFLKSPQSWSALTAPVTGYVIFAGDQSLPADGPIETVSIRDCLIMVEETTEFIYLGIDYPDLNFKYACAPPTNSSDVGEELLFNSASAEESVMVTLRNQVTGPIAGTQVHGTPINYSLDVVIGSNGKDIHFKNLKNGFSVEVKLTRV